MSTSILHLFFFTCFLLLKMHYLDHILECPIGPSLKVVQLRRLFDWTNMAAALPQFFGAASNPCFEVSGLYIRWYQGFWIYLYFRIRHSSAHLRPVILSADWSISWLQSWTLSLPTVAEFVKLTQSIVVEAQRQSADLYKVQLCNRQFFVVSTAIYMVKVYECHPLVDTSPIGWFFKSFATTFGGFLYHSFRWNRGVWV